MRAVFRQLFWPMRSRTRLQKVFADGAARLLHDGLRSLDLAGLP
jgi:hypothetical protein